MPSFSPWSSVSFQRMFGFESRKWSWWCCQSGFARLSPSCESGSGALLRQASAQAWSRATGSNEANIPISGRIGASFSPWQSQFGEMSRTMLMWKHGRPLTTVFVYSAIFYLLLHGMSCSYPSNSATSVQCFWMGMPYIFSWTLICWIILLYIEYFRDIIVFFLSFHNWKSSKWVLFVYSDYMGVPLNSTSFHWGSGFPHLRDTALHSSALLRNASGGATILNAAFVTVVALRFTCIYWSSLKLSALPFLFPYQKRKCLLQ